MHLHWFRSDLRIHDNTSLDAAASQESVLALYILTPKQWQQHDDAPCKVDFWRRQLIELSQQLDRLNIPLLIRHCDTWQQVPDLLLELCQQYQITQVHCNAEYGVNERKRDAATQHLLQQYHIGFKHYLDQLLFEPGSITSKSGGYFKVFGQFKRVCQQRLYDQIPAILPAPKAQAKLFIAADPIAATLADFTLTGAFAKLDQSSIDSIAAQWPVGETQAMQVLDDFCADPILDYEHARDMPALAGVSQISPYINAGIVSVRQCLQAAIDAADGELFGANEGINTWITQLLWREFYQHILVGFPQVSQHQPFKAHTKKLPWRNAPDDLACWQQGQTGFPIIDAAMRQLQQTGWMHNRLRMIVAMFLSKNLLIDWRLGEQWFMQHLIDGDLAANNGGWQWSASTGTDSVPYFRIFNPITQSQKIDPEGTFIRHWLPALAHLDNKSIHAPHLSRNVQASALDYPLPIVDLKQSRERALQAFSGLKA
ncbi:MAG: deoxyribodipyrimidine photo-lyase [Moraxellaceae bacterium]|nr:MAG: deoxyribodipyrimidine photo-lyase [Moraxellaceae bacterium]